MSQLFGFPSGLSGGSKETEYQTFKNTNRSTSSNTSTSALKSTTRATLGDVLDVSFNGNVVAASALNAGPTSGSSSRQGGIDGCMGFMRESGGDDKVFVTLGGDGYHTSTIDGQDYWMRKNIMYNEAAGTYVKWNTDTASACIEVNVPHTPFKAIRKGPCLGVACQLHQGWIQIASSGTLYNNNLGYLQGQGSSYHCLHTPSQRIKGVLLNDQGNEDYDASIHWNMWSNLAENQWVNWWNGVRSNYYSNMGHLLEPKDSTLAGGDDGKRFWHDGAWYGHTWRYVCFCYAFDLVLSNSSYQTSYDSQYTTNWNTDKVTTYDSYYNTSHITYG